jgi:phosphoribosyl-ATP pyrophosphohydrolase/phosphoribosyl-AMP cyclohydrolase
MTAEDIAALDFDKGGGLIPAIVQDAHTGAVLMLGYMNPAALEATLANRQVTFFSRSRQALWRKGETSGNTLAVRSVHADCDRDALLILAEPAGPTCHVGTRSCFGDAALPQHWLDELQATIATRASADPDASYTAWMLSGGTLKIAQKIGEEGVELALAGAAESQKRCIAETADLLYHVALLMEARGFGWAEVGRELNSRRKVQDRSEEEGR